ncbi:serine/threonine protein kinase [Trichophyton tonsurans CBS 112818]|uniref:Altered inheritance of mitochondria protein 9, mitochondrial n=1 Tax=Trichophyton tonsurans (strain CBS 112818) TaxID=647933 RepID=F2RSI7_TRIT1|nr:serine/threonine protein kinase [Trichophyton tonsurans CBS 112818]
MFFPRGTNLCLMRCNRISSLLRRTSAARKLHISSRGKPITKDKLFEYTNGGFLVNEKFQLSRRYVQFNLDALCDSAATSRGQPSPVRAVEKIEGGFSKALLMKREDGTEVVAKIPCRNSGPAVYTTETEVGILKYVKQHTSVPVPEVYAWSSDPTNPVGAEYIIMEKAAGILLFKIWGEISLSDKLELVKRLTAFERELCSLQLPAYGSLYLRSFGGGLPNFKPLGIEADPSQSYCVGRSADRVYAPEDVEGLNIDLGPWDTLATFGIAIARREIARALQGLPPHPGTFYQGSCEEKVKLLDDVINLMRMLSSTSHPVLAQLGKPVIWHTDLHMGNIYVSPDDPSQILSIIDWQSISVLPLFLQARWPIFLEPPENFVQGFQAPKLPDNLKEMNEEDQQLAKFEYRQAMVAKTSSYCHEPPACLSRAVQALWRDVRKWYLASSRVEDEIAEHDAQFTDYEDWYKANEIARKCLDTDEEGWISPELDIEEKHRQNRELFEMFVKQMSAEKTPEEARRMWPFVHDNK